MSPLAHTAIQLGPGPLAFGLNSAAALPPLAAFPRYFSYAATLSLVVYISMSLGCNFKSGNSTAPPRQARTAAHDASFNYCSSERIVKRQH